MDSTVERQVTTEQLAAERNHEPASAQRLGRLFRVLVVGGVVLAVAMASVPRGATGDADPDGGPTDGGGTPGW